MVFAKNFARNYEKKKYLEHLMLGQWDNRPIDPAYYIEDCRISTFLFSFFENLHDFISKEQAIIWLEQIP